MLILFNMICSAGELRVLSCMQIQPHFHQAETLKATVEDQIVKEGLIGVGVGAGLLGLIAIGITAFASRR